MENQEVQISKDDIVNGLKMVFDPEIPVDIFEMGLIYDIKVNQTRVDIVMTLTSPSCPAAQSIPMDVKDKVGRVEGVEDVEVEIVWEPPWGMEMMSEVAKLELGYF